jgi:hypothetical protein
MMDANNYFYQRVSDWHSRKAIEGPIRFPRLYERVTALMRKDRNGEATEEEFLAMLDEIDPPPENSSELAAEFPIELVPFLDERVSIRQLARMLFMRPKSLDKWVYKSEWPPPDEPHAGSRPAKWQLRRILPVLLDQFGNRIRPPEPD